MVALDTYVIEFVKQNLITLTLTIGIFRAVAKLTKSKIDDEIGGLLANLLATVRGKGKKKNAT